MLTLEIKFNKESSFHDFSQEDLMDHETFRQSISDKIDCEIDHDVDCPKDSCQEDTIQVYISNERSYMKELELRGVKQYSLRFEDVRCPDIFELKLKACVDNLLRPLDYVRLELYFIKLLIAHNQFPMDFISLENLIETGYVYGETTAMMIDTFRYLLSSKLIDVNMKSETGETLLHRKFGLKLFNIFIDFGYDPTVGNSEGNTILHLHQSSAEFFAENNQSMFQRKNNLGETPLMTCLSEVSEISFGIMVKNSDLHATDNNSDFPLMKTKGAFQTNYLISVGANPLQTNDKGQTALHRNSSYANFFALEKYISLDTIDDHGMTPIFYIENFKIISKLIKRGCDFSHKDNEGKCYIWHLIERRNYNCAVKLLENTDIEISDDLLEFIKNDHLCSKELRALVKF